MAGYCRKECPEENPMTTVRLIQERIFMCTIKGKASAQDEKYLRQESKIPVKIGRKAKTDCRIVLGEIIN